jgi:hypothetical protein
MKCLPARARVPDRSAAKLTELVEGAKEAADGKSREHRTML